MNDHVNGAPVTGGQQDNQQPAPEQTPKEQYEAGREQKSAAQQNAEQMAGPVITCMFNGLMTSLRHLPGDVILVTTCEKFGQILSAITAMGTIKDQLALRQRCRAAFDKGLNSQTIKMPPPPQQGPGARRPSG